MNTTIEEEKTEFKFSELSESAKQRACQEYSEHCMDHDWWEFVYEDYAQKCEAAGFHDPEFSFSGFWSQGDGASFKCNYSFTGDEALQFLDQSDTDAFIVLCARFRFEGEQLPKLHLTGSIDNRNNHHSHSNTMSIDYDRVELELPLDGVASELADAASEFEERVGYYPFKGILEAARDIAQDLYRSLEKEYEYQTSEEQVAETSEANDWLYDENGRII